MDELKPCPFCGGEVWLTYIGNDHTKKRSVEVSHNFKGVCPVKFKQSALIKPHEWLAGKVVEAWNTRKGDDNEQI